MSFHRVLPLLPDLSNQALKDRWAIPPDSLVASKIMPDNISAEEVASKESDLTKPTSKGSPSIDDQGPSSPGEEELDDCRPRKSPDRSLSQTPDAHIRLHKTIEKLSEEVLDGWQGDSPSSICLCQPDPKVPRPRNAFILYRQHNQAAVVQQNPGLANPEISKIIGDHWRNLASEEKNHWKLLAEEEKIRHSKQYPDYRYQPRRSGRNSITTSSQPSSTETSPRKCPKCGGRSIAASSMMSGSAISTPKSGASSRFRGLNLNSPAISNPPSGHLVRPSTTSGGAPLRLVSPPYRRNDERNDSPHFKRPENARPFLRSPDAKRRRITTTSYNPVRGPTGPTTPFPFTAGGHNRRQSLPRPDFMGPGLPSPITMGPPPRPHNTQQHPSAPLTLAPIQPPHPDAMQIDTQEKSLEAMILSIPTLGKIRVLSKISPPLAPAGPTSPARQTRGLVIAIDASDTASIQQLTQTLTSNLHDFTPRVFATPSPPPSAPPSFQAYLRLIDQYHTLSAQVTDYITTLPTPSPQPPEKDSPSPVSPKSFPKDLPSKNHPTTSESNPIPVAIIPGFQVTWSDWFASHVRISDAYSPMDHWQWGATLWRNVIGADVTVAVQAATVPAEEAALSAKTGASAGGGGVGSHKAEGGRKGKDGGGVEVRLEDARAVVVRGAEGGGVLEGGLRRVGFEIGEWVRGWEDREGGRRGSLQV